MESVSSRFIIKEKIKKVIQKWKESDARLKHQRARKQY